MKRVLLFVLLGIALHGLMGCSDGEAGQPREIRAGEDVCELCHMTVDDPLRAAQWVDANGRVVMFDEPGCLITWLKENPGASGEAFVSDEAGSGWIPAGEAAFVHGATRTSMGFDVIAYRDPLAARETGGKMMVWRDLLEQGVQRAYTN